MSSDELTKAIEEAWVYEQRERVVSYLDSQECRHAGVGEWPAFHVAPYFALWAVQSRMNAGRVGWWAVSGDIPTDYMSSSDGYYPRDAMRHFSRVWAEAADFMQKGTHHPEVKFGSDANRDELAPLLSARSKILRDWADDAGLWNE